MDQLVVKCRCRGTNGDCHLCFGTGDVLAHGEDFTATAVARAAPKPLVKSPSKQPHRPSAPKDFEHAFLAHAGLARRREASVLMEAAQLCSKRGEPGPMAALRGSVRCARPQFGPFLVALAAAVRTDAVKVVSALVDINGHLRDGGSPARFNVESVRQLAAAWRAQTGTRPDEARIARRIDADGEVPEVAVRRPPDSEATSTQPSRRIDNVLVVSSGKPVGDRVSQLGLFVARHAFARLYLGAPKKVLRELTNEYPAIDIVHVENAANLTFIRKGVGVAVFDLDSANG
jgi:hypothetical protein